jgi:hypothetical protein
LRGDTTSISLEEALGLCRVKSVQVPDEISETAASSCEGEKRECISPDRIRFSLFDRRKMMLLAHYNGELFSSTFARMAAQFECSEKDLRDDWADRESWGTFVCKPLSDCEIKESLRSLRLIREKLDCSKVYAGSRLAEAVRAEIEAKQILGLLPRVSEPDQIIKGESVRLSKANVETMELLKKYEHFFKEPTERTNLPKDNSAKQMDKAETDSETSGVSIAGQP